MIEKLNAQIAGYEKQRRDLIAQVNAFNGAIEALNKLKQEVEKDVPIPENTSES